MGWPLAIDSEAGRFCQGVYSQPSKSQWHLQCMNKAQSG